MSRSAKPPPSYQVRYYFSSAPPEGFRQRARLSYEHEGGARHHGQRIASRGARVEVWRIPATGQPHRIDEYAPVVGVPEGEDEDTDD